MNLIIGPDAPLHWEVQEFRKHVKGVQLSANHLDILYYDLEIETTDGRRKKHVNRLPDHILRRLVDDKTCSTQEGMTNAHILADELQRTPCRRYRSKRGIILKWILKKQDVRIWTKFK